MLYVFHGSPKSATAVSLIIVDASPYAGFLAFVITMWAITHHVSEKQVFTQLSDGGGWGESMALVHWSALPAHSGSSTVQTLAHVYRKN